MVFLALNWNFEVYTYFIASFIALSSVILIFREYLRVRSHFHLYLTISWLFLFLYVIGGGIAILRLSKTLFVFEILALIPSAFFLVLVFDKLTRSALDPNKMFIFGCISAGVVISAFDIDAAIVITLNSGYPSFQTNGAFHIWITIFTAVIGVLFFYYCLLIYIRSPPHLKRKAFITLIGGIFFSVISFFLFLTRLTKIFPGIMLVSLALGSFLASISFYVEPKLLDILVQSEAEAKLKKISKILSICANCKKIRETDESWQSVEEFFLKHSKILFSHGMCPDCAREYYPEFLNDEDKKE